MLDFNNKDQMAFLAVGFAILFVLIYYLGS